MRGAQVEAEGPRPRHACEPQVSLLLDKLCELADREVARTVAASLTRRVPLCP